MKKVLTLIFLLLFSVFTFAEVRTPILDSLIEYDEFIDTLTIKFTQVNYFDDTKLSTNKGILYFDKKRDLIRVDSLDVFDELEQYAIANGKTIKIYDKKNKLITQTDWKTWYENQPNKFLFDFGNYGDILVYYKLTEHTDYHLEFVDLADKNQKVEFDLTKKYFPKVIRVMGDDITNVIFLTKTEINESINKGVFKQYDTIK